MDILQAYRERLAATYRFLDAHGMLYLQHLEQVPLDEVYVPLHVRSEVGGALELPYNRYDSDMHRRLLALPENEDAAAELVLRERYPEHGSQRLTLEQLWERGQHWILLGNAGAGKSTLLCYLALTHAQQERERAPLLVRLAHFAQHWGQHPDWDAKDALLRYIETVHLAELGFAESELEPLYAALRERLEQQQLLLLFDGLDAVHEEQQQLCVRALENLLSHYPGNRCLLTMRRHSYSGTLFALGYQVGILEPFNQAQVRQFFRQWLYMLEKHNDVTVDEHTRALALRKTETLLRGVEECSCFYARAANPLLCTLIGLVQKNGQLPEQAIALYKLGVDSFIIEWELQCRRQDKHTCLDRNEVLEMLKGIALHLHEHCPNHQIDLSALLAAARHWLQQHNGLSAEEAQSKAAYLQRLIAQEVGLLIPHGEQRYSFFHLSFQEYLAATALAGQPRLLQQYLQRYLFSPAWRGVFRLLVAYQGMQDELAGSAAISAILVYPHPREADMHYSFRIAFACMQEARVSAATAEQLFHTWTELYLHKPALQPALTRLLRRYRHHDYQPENVDALFAALEDDNPSVRSKATEMLGYLPLAAVEERLLDLLGDEQTLVRGKAAEALGHLQSQRAVPQLLRLLQQENAFFVRRLAARALTQIHAPDALPTLLAQLGQADAVIRARLAEALGYLQDARAAASLLDLLRRDNAAPVRWRAAEALGHLQVEEAQPELIAVLRQDADPSVRSRAAEALGQYDGERVLPELLRALTQDSFPAVRWRAAEALGHQCRYEAVPYLLSALKDDVDNAVRWSAAEALGKLRDPHAVMPLLVAVQADRDPSVRWSAARALGQLKDPQAVPVLLRVACEDRYGPVRAHACRALGHFDDPQALPELRRIVRQDKDPGVRRHAAEALGYLGDAEISVGVLSTVLNEDKEATVRWCAAEALGNLRAPAAADSLLRALNHDADISVRWRAADSLEKIDLGCVL